MLTEQQNALLTQVGPGTTAGEFLRRYWMPVAPMQDLTDEQPTKFDHSIREYFGKPRATTPAR